MIKVSVENFQSIEKADIEINGFTVVTGKNNSGKSALLRSINSVFTNAKGSSFVRYGEDYCQVSLTFDDGNNIRWKKGAKVKPTYWINGGDPIHSGRNAPTELEQFGIAPITANGRELWCQIAPQFTGQVFLIDMPGSVMAEIVADVDRVSDLNSALKNCEKDKRANNSVLKIRNKDHQALSKERELYDDLEDRCSEFKELEYQRSYLQDLRDRIEKLQVLKAKLRDQKMHIFSLSEIISDLKPVSDLEETLISIQDTKQRIETFGKLGRTYRKRNRELQQLVGVDLLSLPSIDKVKELREQLKPLVPLNNRKQSATLTLSQLSEIQDITLPTTEKIKATRDQLKTYKPLTERYRQSEKILSSHNELSQIEIPTFEYSSERMVSVQGLKTQYENIQNSVYIITEEYKIIEQSLTDLSESIAQSIQEHGECPYCGEEQ